MIIIAGTICCYISQVGMRTLIQKCEMIRLKLYSQMRLQFRRISFVNKYRIFDKKERKKSIRQRIFKGKLKIIMFHK